MFAIALAALTIAAAPTSAPRPAPRGDAALARAGARATAALVEKHGAAQRPRIDRGVAQVLAYWRAEDGDAAALQSFLEEQFVSSAEQVDALFERLETAFEQLDGHALELNRELARPATVDLGPMQPVDGILSAYDAGAGTIEALFANKVAFAALLNFPLTTLQERLANGETWSRRQWAEARLTGRFARRVPADVNAAIARATAASELYIADYNVFMHHVVAGPWDAVERPFPKGLRLLSHWNLRDQIKAEYAKQDGLARQRLIAKVMERIVAQEIPGAVVNDPRLDWNPVTNEVRLAPADAVEGSRPALQRANGGREPDTRYARILGDFQAVRRADPYSPIAPTHIARKFDLEREMPEARVVELLRSVLESPLVPKIAALIEQRLGRPLEPHDIWYDGFRPRSSHSEAELDAMTRQRYPDAEAFRRDLPNVLQKIGFEPERASYLAERIAVDPARGSGHALEARRRGDKPRLRTRVGPDGMDYKGFNIAVHELGHNVEQVFSLYGVDHTLLQGVPNTAFTEAIAFVFQARDLEVLGLERPDAEAKRLLALNDLWMTYEIAGVAMVDLEIWRWMYAHPRATPAELRQATLRIARDAWNRWYAPVFGKRDVTLLAIYSHIVNNLLYTPDYPLGHLIAAQLEEHLDRAGNLGAEIERVTRIGAIAPDVWMKQATGSPVSAGPLLRGAEAALAAPARTTAR
ncbi:MAG TPA: hypothetical protein VFK85_02135 [Anaeromyxobacteraceae bacterium]|nr:hypothetical protein [Anaeromyxobacteraceae bacterium]